MIVIGLDPGGLNSFGWACLQIGESGNPIALNTGLASSAPSALDSAGKIASFAPVAVGIDAPLYWVREGDRKADADIRKRICVVGGKSGTVSHVNSLRGACLVQGILAAHQVVETWPDVIVTEAHPKALLLIHPAAGQFLASYLPNAPTEHQRDAALAAYTAWAVATQFSGWHNLVPEEHDPFFPSGHRVSYWFPSAREAPSAR
jgi:predicted nuclease with RNAse H fold